MSEQLVHLLAGGLSGMTVDFLLYPMDTIKTRLQARKSLVAAIPKSGAFYRGEAKPCLLRHHLSLVLSRPLLCDVDILSRCRIVLDGIPVCAIVTCP